MSLGAADDDDVPQYSYRIVFSSVRPCNLITGVCKLLLCIAHMQLGFMNTKQMPTWSFRSSELRLNTGKVREEP